MNVTCLDLPFLKMEDRALHRLREDCYLSSSWERRCATDENGKLRCETLSQQWRHCPGRAPEEVTTERLSSEDQPHHPPPPTSPERWRGAASPDAGKEQMMRHMETMMEAFGMLGGLMLGPRLEAPLAPHERNRQEVPAPPPIRVDEV